MRTIPIGSVHDRRRASSRENPPLLRCASIAPDALVGHGARVLAIEAGKTIVIDQEQTIALADRYGITIVARAA